jgi:predicted enzyme related to lactoylglutathione lyase
LSVLINIDVPDLDTGVAFYTTGLGFALRRYLFAGAVAELEYAGVRFYLLVAPARSAPVAGKPMTRDYADHWTPVHLDLTVTDVEAARQKAMAAGARAVGPIRDTVFGRIASLRDPFGHGLCLIEFNDQGYGSAE